VQVRPDTVLIDVRDFMGCGVQVVNPFDGF
jgi:hypothetical protein